MIAMNRLNLSLSGAAEHWSGARRIAEKVESMNVQPINPGSVVLVGPREATTRVAALISAQDWPIQQAQSPIEAQRHLRRGENLDLVILAPATSLDEYVELCRQIKLDQRTRFVAVVFILPPPHAARGAEILQAGADDCIRLIAPDRELLLRLEKAIRIKRATDCLEDSEAVIAALAKAIEGKDEYTCGHVDRVSTYCMEIGRRVGVDFEGIRALKIGGIVHDIGKVGVPDQILNKPGKLTDEEMTIMKRHPLIGYDILKELRTFNTVLPIVRWHHERPNGKGYPDGLAGDDLPLLPRIAAVADWFDALTTDRPYRKGFTVEKSRQIMWESAEAGDLDPKIVQVLFQILEQGALSAAA